MEDIATGTGTVFTIRGATVYGGVRTLRALRHSRPEAHDAVSVSRLGHLLRVDPRVELVGGEHAEGEGGFLERRAVLVRLLGDLCGVVVADVRIERGHEHQAAIEV